MILPQPGGSDWKAWGNQLVFKLVQILGMPFRAEAVMVADLQDPTENGIVLLVPDASGGPTLAVSYEGVFYDVRTGVAVV